MNLSAKPMAWILSHLTASLLNQLARVIFALFINKAIP